MPPDLSLVIPCYNEGEHFRQSASELLEVLDQLRLEAEVVFVDDCSRDDTREQIAEVCARDPRCRAILHERNRGRGAAFKTGFAATTGRVAGFCDIDLEVHPVYIPMLVALIDRHGVDVATGLRYYLLSQTRGLHRAVLSRIYRWVCRWLLDAGVRDTETGFKMFRREKAGAVVLGSESDGWFWDTEVMTRAALAGLRIQEFPVLFLRRWDKTSTVRFLPDIWRYLVELQRFRPRVGLGLLDRSPLYWTCIGYDLVSQLAFGRQARATLAAVADRIPDGASVVDLCCGTARLAREFLLRRGCAYVGIDANGHFVMGTRKRGVTVRLADVTREPIPSADYVVMCSSLYHFGDAGVEMIRRMRAAARRAVIVSEPVRNMTALPGGLGAIIARLTNPGTGGDYLHRHDLASFRAVAEAAGAIEFVHHPGDRDALAVCPPA
jgi:glycosyltransferase involved in cell wall biosynthesis